MILVFKAFEEMISGDTKATILRTIVAKNIPNDVFSINYNDFSVNSMIMGYDTIHYIVSN